MPRSGEVPRQNIVQLPDPASTDQATINRSAIMALKQAQQQIIKLREEVEDLKSRVEPMEHIIDA